MTLTRTQAGETPRRTEHPGYVETPHRRSRARRQTTHKENGTLERKVHVDAGEDGSEIRANFGKSKQNGAPIANGHAINGSALGKSAGGKLRSPLESLNFDATQASATHDAFEFGGPWGAVAMMIGFPLLMYYMWIGATFYNGAFPLPNKEQSFLDFAIHMADLVYNDAFPNIRAWMIYWAFFVFEAVCYLYLPGITAKGLPLEHEGGQQLTYHCSAVWSFYVTIAVAASLHVSGIFKLYAIMDEFGPIMSVAIISGFAVSFAAYISAFYRGATHRMTGNHVYDFFMGAELNPRMLGLLDFKMFFEVRLPWYIMFLLTCGTAARQYEQFGWVSGEIGFLLMAHFLYANACSKGEECIVPTWDIYHEKWGFMLIFWNLAGVPFTYCHCTVFLANFAPSTYHWNRTVLVLLYASYLFVYWVWDTTNSQKNRFRQEQSGRVLKRKAFPQLPWQTVENPKKIDTKEGPILVDGWYAYARKLHYSCDLFFALTWGSITGFQSPFPWFYPVFFGCMIMHRAARDITRCRQKYGEGWKEYELRVPYLFIPYVY